MLQGFAVSPWFSMTLSTIRSAIARYADNFPPPTVRRPLGAVQTSSLRESSLDARPEPSPTNGRMPDHTDTIRPADRFASGMALRVENNR